MKQLSLFLYCTFYLINLGFSQEIPKVYTNIEYNENRELVFKYRDTSYKALEHIPQYSIEGFTGNITGNDVGIAFNFINPAFHGRLYYGLIHYNDSKHPLPVYFKSSAKVDSGKALIDIKNKLSGRYDMIGWEKSGRGVIGYRIQDSQGNMLYEGRVAFLGNGPFTVGNVITEGPFVDLITHHSAVISISTFKPIKAQLKVGDKQYAANKELAYHEFKVDDLQPDTEYNYSFEIDGIVQEYSFKTAPMPGSREPFTFAYASDSRSGPGGGERSVHGVNYYIMKKIMSLAVQQNAVFFQFTGDLIDGYLTNDLETHLQYANWKRAVEPWGHYFPVYEGMGNHEALCYYFPVPNTYWGIMIDKFPFETQSSEAIFNSNFVNPTNGPASEDGAEYDPDPKATDFPPYKENVFYYTYDNVAVISLNSNYFYAPSLSSIPQSSGNLHGYILDVQLEWLEEVINTLENDETIDHIFVTQHTPAFPNGGHVHDDMWYNGNNQYRPWIAGKVLPKGIIERRDEYLDILINKSTKVLAILTGDEHNYCRTTISPDMPRYPESGYFAEKIELSRTIYQVNNGAAGAPYYAQQETPWTSFTDSFTTQHALVLIHVDGLKVELEVLNPDTLEEIDRFTLRDK